TAPGRGAAPTPCRTAVPRYRTGTPPWTYPILASARNQGFESLYLPHSEPVSTGQMRDEAGRLRMDGPAWCLSRAGRDRAGRNAVVSASRPLSGAERGGADHCPERNAVAPTTVRSRTRRGGKVR